MCRVLNIKEEEHFDILFWSIFFTGFFDDKLNSVFPNPLIRDEFFRLETMAYSLSSAISGKEQIQKAVNIEFKIIDDDDLIKAYEQLRNGKSDELNIVDPENIKQPFSDSLLFDKNRKDIGFVNHDIDGSPHIAFDESSFLFGGLFPEKPVTFYGNINDKLKQKLKNT